MEVTGIEISESAIGLAAKNFGSKLVIHQGSVTDMPFDDQRYDGIFCHALVYLLDEYERASFIQGCYAQLADDGVMVFTAIAKTSPTFGRGTLISKDRYEQHGGAKIFFFDEASIHAEFGNYGLNGISVVHEDHPLYLINSEKKD